MSSLISSGFYSLDLVGHSPATPLEAIMKTTSPDSIDSTMLAPDTKLLTATLHGSDLAAKRTIQLQTREVFDDNRK